MVLFLSLCQCATCVTIIQSLPDPILVALVYKGKMRYKCMPCLVATVISYLVENKRYCCVHILLKSLFAFWDNNSLSFPVLVANPGPNTSSTEENLSACFRSKTFLFCVSGPSCKVAKTAKKPIHYLLITGRYLCYSLLSVFFFKCFQIRITTLKPYFIATEGTY